ncbi:MAG: nitroreductase family protein [Candidatus Woesearchaeota archaeon]|jgi:nitroreductase
MDVINAIKARTSIRKYQNKEITRDTILELIDAARLAPSGNNSQPSKYLIIQDVKIKNMLKKNKIFVQKFVYESPVIIVCCANPLEYKKKSTLIDSTNDLRAVRDLSIASSFLILRATELGLGTCYVGWVKKEEIKSLLNIPMNYIVPYVITVGYPAEKPEARARKNIEEIIL